MPSQQTPQAPKPSAACSSKVEVDFRHGRIPAYDYQRGALLENIAEAAEKLGMSGKVVATAMSHEQDTGNVGRSTWKVELRRPLVPAVEECIILRIRTSYTVPSILPSFGRKK